MALKDITDPEAVRQAIAEFDALGRDAFLKRYGFQHARRLFVEYEGEQYDSKALLGAAHGFQFPDQGPLSLSDFKSGELTTAKKLRDLGFEPVVRSDSYETAGQSQSLSELIRDVLELQQAWSQANTTEMKERGALIRRSIPAAIGALLPGEGTLPFTPSVEGSDGAGRKARVPWVRIYSETHSPSATNGWYVVLLFAADGSAAYLALGSGTSQFVQGLFRARPAEWLAKRISWARETLANSDTNGLSKTIQLGDPGGLGAQYERGTVVARSFPADEEFDDDDFERVLLRLVYLLGELYTHGERGVPPGSGARLHCLPEGSDLQKQLVVSLRSDAPTAPRRGSE